MPRGVLPYFVDEELHLRELVVVVFIEDVGFSGDAGAVLQDERHADAVKAVEAANAAGAITIAMTGNEHTGMAKVGQYVVTYSNGDDQIYSQSNQATVLRIGFELLHQFEGYENYEKAMQAYSVIDEIVAEAKKEHLPLATAWAEKQKDEPLFYVLASGSNYVRFGDGTQICWGWTTPAPNISSTEKYVSFPIPFAEDARVLTCSNANMGGTPVQVGWETSTGFVIGCGWNGIQSSGGDTSWLAIGRWK